MQTACTVIIIVPTKDCNTPCREGPLVPRRRLAVANRSYASATEADANWSLFAQHFPTSVKHLAVQVFRHTGADATGVVYLSTPLMNTARMATSTPPTRPAPTKVCWDTRGADDAGRSKSSLLALAPFLLPFFVLFFLVFSDFFFS